MAKREQLMQGLKEQGTTDRSAVKSQMDQLKEEENQKLSQVLTADQMSQWHNKQSQMRQGHKHGRRRGESNSSESGQ